MLCEPDRVPYGVIDADPVARLWREHLRRELVPHGQRVLFNRRWLSDERGELPSEVQAACWLDVKRVYMELRPELRRFYLAFRDIETYGPIVGPLGFVALPEAVEIDGVAYHSAEIDVGRRLAREARRQRAADRVRLHPRPHRSAARSRRAPHRPHAARVRRPRLHEPAAAEGGGTFGPAARRLGIHPRRQQRRRHGCALHPAKARRAGLDDRRPSAGAATGCGFHREIRPRPSLQVDLCLVILHLDAMMRI